MRYSGRIEYAGERKIRSRNKPYYRLAHWPIWIWVFFLAPGPLTFSLFDRGFHWVNWTWLAAVLIGTGIAGLFGQLPGVEPAPYILRFDEDKPNPLYRRVCYTFAWNAVLNFALLNMAGLAYAVVTGVWRLKQIYLYSYSPLCAIILLLGIVGKLPRVGPSTKGEGTERALFLRLGLGRHRGAVRSADSLEDAARNAHRQPHQAGCLCGRAGHHGRCGFAREAAPHAAHPARRVDGFRLRRGPAPASRPHERHTPPLGFSA